MKKREDERKEALWVSACRGWRVNGGMVENSNVSVSVGSPAVCAESIAHHNIHYGSSMELMKCVSCAVAFLKLH